MSKATSIPWWSSLGFGKRAPAPDTDYADMGTAFGLDASLDALPASEPGASADKENTRLSVDGTGRAPRR